MCSPMDTPGSQALEAARNMKDLAVFKKPVGVAKRSKIYRPKILDEDSYIEKMGEIIQRDFFPHLEKLKAQNDYLDALEQNNIKRMRELYEKYSSGRPVTERPASPATFETPLHTNEADRNALLLETTPKDPRMDSTKHNTKTEHKIGLDTYLSSHTSEDNASFEEMMVEAEKKHKLKYAWLYETEEKSKLLAIERNTEAPLAIQAGDNKPLELDSWSYRNKNYIMYVPDGVELTPEEQVEMAKRKQEVLHENTRLKINPFNEQQNKETITELAKTQSKVNDGKIGVDGKEVIRNPTPRVNGFSFVATPSPRPGECESPLMTWGQIEGTPFRLDGGDTPLFRTSQGPSFRMAEPPKREQIALQLAEKAGERHRDRKNKALEAARRSLATPSPRSLSTIERLNTMSPAARRLATQKLKIVGTPTPRRMLSSRTPSVRIRTPNTPRAHTPVSGTGSVTSENNLIHDPVLTDNLLNLPPQRQRAADFFNK
ncbi:splicing factor ESS-2 homolog [Cephus cinctus]|uniref:Splicing factor ESS-2 homolog n=1 Tax=Cephus cinctus TaxID=211228 RepID=A0AAJ7BRL4_CEPCN|nr:splicing factor ESS-2 homolog [Cephus cinctus]XP_015592670.1 splicing factor ESS-2 homolog [Cephus cinctus]